MRFNNKGFTIADLLAVMGIIGLLASLAIPAFAQYNTRFDSEAKAHLQHLYRACKGYWLDNGSSSSCNVTLASGTAYGYLQTATINITASGGETAFTGTASHVDSVNTYTINSRGEYQLTEPRHLSLFKSLRGHILSSDDFPFFR